MNNQKNNIRKNGDCQNCSLHSDAQIYLSCTHHICLKCLAFSYHKYSHTLKNPSIIRCLICQQVSELNDKDLRAITHFTNQFLIPLVRQDEKLSSKNKQSQFGFTPSDLSSGNKQLKSLQQSIQKTAPVNRGFYSKCQSPKTSLPSGFCPLHPDQQLSIVCFTCSNSILCISCVSTKKHNTHNMKTISKGLETIQQKISLSCLKSKEFINKLEMTKRRLQDRRQLIQQRWQKSINSLKLHFNNLLDLVNKKCHEIVQGYSDIFQKSIEEITFQSKKVQSLLKHSKKQLQKLMGMSKTHTNPVEMIKKSTFIMQEISQMKEPQIQGGELACYDTDKLVRDIVFLCEKVQKMDSNNYYFPSKYQIQNYKSQQKNKDNFYKRIKTNIISLNSSRDKRQKKGTKTQEDQKRNKSKAAYKGQSSSKIQKINKALPTYLLQHLDKSSKNLQIAQCLAQLNPLQSSLKSTSKILSKSHIPSAIDDNRKKKEHIAYIKQCLQRKERKTFNGNSKQLKNGNECMKKKKIPN